MPLWKDHCTWPARSLAGYRVAMVTLALVVSLCLPASLSVGRAQGVTINREYAIKAAFLYNFLIYVDWPEGAFEDPQEPYVIGVFESDPFGTHLSKIAATKNVKGREIEVRSLSSVDQVHTCHILFVPAAVSDEKQREVMKAVAGTPVLCVGEADEFAQQGGAAQFYVESNKVRFAFNTHVVDQSRLKVSSKLLSLARIVSTP